MKSFFDNKFTVIGKLDIFDDIDIVRVGKYNYPIRNSLIKKVKFYEGKVVRAVIGRDSLTKEIKILSIEEENSKDYNRKKNDVLEYHQKSNFTNILDDRIKSQAEKESFTLWWIKHWDDVFENSIREKKSNRVILFKDAYSHYKDFCKRKNFKIEKRGDFKMCFEICDYIKVYKDNKLNRDVIELEITGESSIKDIFVSPSLVTELIVEIKDKEGSLVMIKEVNSL